MDEAWMKILARKIRTVLSGTEADFLASAEEIRLRAEKPLAVTRGDGNWYLRENGKPTKKSGEAYLVSPADLAETMEYVSRYSRYAYEDELRQGFITVRHGHRVGVCGRAVVMQGEIRSIKYVNGLNVRIAREITGCSDGLFPVLYPDGKIGHTLIYSAPGCGKTTLLRDLVRRISDGQGLRVSLADERGELAACEQGIPQLDVGRNTDVLDACPKAEGMLRMIRTMNPQVLAVDEIGSEAESAAMENAISCGCVLLATIHAGSWRELAEKPYFADFVRRKLWKRYVELARTEDGRIGWRMLDADGREAARGWR